MKKKLLSPTELREFRTQQAEQKRLRAEELERKNRRLSAPKELLDPKPEPVIEEPEVVEEPKEPIEILRERIEQLAAQIKEPKYYDEQIAQLEVILASKIGFDEFNLAPIEEKIQSLKESVPELPEVKYYDDELQEVQRQLNELDIRYYETDIESLTERVDQLQISGSEIFKQHGENLKEIKKAIHQVIEDLVKVDNKEIPEAFDPTDIHNDIVATKETFYERVAELKKEISELPEVKYYDRELRDLKERIQIVKDSIPEVPEVKYYDDDLESLLGLIEEVRGNVSQLPEVKYYENEIAQLEEAIKSVEDRIPTVPEVRYYEDDIEALREEIKSVEGQIPEVPEIPEIKYYDEEVEVLSEDINKVRDSLIDIKLAIKAVEKSVEVVEGREIPEAFDPTGLQIEIEKAFKEIEKLKEQPVSVKEDSDPLTPLEDKFVTFEDLADHYRTFINRIQQQLSSLGGGGEVNLRYLDDIDRSSISDGKVLSYDAATKKFKFISPGAASSLWSEQGANIYRNSNVGIRSTQPTATLDVNGTLNVSGVSAFQNDVNIGVGGTTAFFDVSTGYVGIGSTQPGSTLVVNAPSGHTGNVLDLRVGTSPIWEIDEEGNLDLDSGNASGIKFRFRQLFLGSSTRGINISADSGTDYATRIRGDQAYGWTDTNNNYSNFAAGLFSDGYNIVAQRNGVGAGQTFRVYNTYTSSTNFERANVGWTTDVFIVGTEKGSAGGTARQLELHTDGTARVAITTTGLVGINNVNPQAALDVVGDVNITGVITATSFSGTLTGEFVGNLDKTLEYYASGSLSTVTTPQGTKTLYYDNAGILTGIVGTGSYVSKEFTYDGDGNLININVL